MKTNFKKYFKISSLLLVIVAVIFAGIKFFSKNSESVISLKTVSLKTADVVNSVTATGTVEPMDTIQVGTQVSGLVSKIYVDFNSEVKKGQLLAELDKNNLQESVNSALSQYNAAKNDLDYNTLNYNRQNNMFKAGVISKAEYEQAYNQMVNAKLVLQQRETALKQARTNLGYANIYAPIDGIVLRKAVEEGQTVTASMSTPTLFALAKDITQMQVNADVDEADIGSVKVNQRVSFTVDAYPDEVFEGIVSQIRLNPTTTSNVVTYKVIIKVDNADKKLLPGLTATITIYTKELKNVNALPAAAVNFSPDVTLLAAYYQENNIEKAIPEIRQNTKTEKFIWVLLADRSLEQRKITVGESDGINVEIISGLAGSEKVISNMEEVVQQEAASGSEESPFMPKRPGSTKKSTQAAPK